MTHRGRYSASQIATFRECARKWAFDKIEGLPRPENVYAERGKRIHAILEAWLRDGTPPTVLVDDETSAHYAAIATAGLPHLPQPGVATVEGRFELALPSADFLGYIDARWVGDDGIPVVLDHKTTSGLQWAKTEDDLREDAQAQLYAAVAMRDAGAAAAVLRWVYYETGKKPRSKKVELTVLRADVEEQIELIDETAREMNEVYESGSRALDLPPNVSACGAYGGCPYVAQCNLSNAEKMRGFMTTQTWAEKIKARKAAQNGEPIAAADEFVNPPEAPKVQQAELVAAPKAGTIEPAIEEQQALDITPEPKTTAKKFSLKKKAETAPQTPPPATVEATVNNPAEAKAFVDRYVSQGGTASQIDTAGITIQEAAALIKEQFGEAAQEAKKAAEPPRLASVEPITKNVKAPTAAQTDANIGASILGEMDRRLAAASAPRSLQEKLEALFDNVAARCYAASIARGEPFVNEAQRAQAAFNRAEIFLGARDAKVREINARPSTDGPKAE